LDRALERIADGDYGRCERCNEPISPDRLLARPTARTCITCASLISAKIMLALSALCVTRAD